MAKDTISIDTSVLINNIQELAKIGKDTKTGGITRLAFSKEDMQAVEFLTHLIKRYGLGVKIDPCGNIYAILDGKNRDSYVMCGSHIDTVPNSGMYNGVLGVLGGIESIKAIKDAGIKPEHTIMVGSFVDEEGRYQGLLGSRIVMGELNLDHLKNFYDGEGRSAYQAMKECGYKPDNISEAVIPHDRIKAFLEFHIDSGPILVKENLACGIVEKFAAPSFLRLLIKGIQAHAGATPMDMRHDPVMGACELANFVEQVAKKSSPSAVATVGYINASPGVKNIIPSSVQMHFDIRDYDKFARDDILASLINKIHKVCWTRQLEFEILEMYSLEPVACSKKIIKIIEDVFRKFNQTPFKLTSGAIFDSATFAKYVDTGVIFVRCKTSISHSPEELVDPTDLEVALNIFANTLLKLSTETS